MSCRIAVVVLIAGCAHREPKRERKEAADEGEHEPWRCTAYVSRVTTAERIDVQGHGPTIEEAYADAWKKACVVLPQADPPTPCSPEAPRSGWTWTREDLEGVVTLHLLPDPPPYQGVAESPVSQDEACAAAYALACKAAGAEPECQSDPAFVDGGVGAVADVPAGETVEDETETEPTATEESPTEP